MCRLPPRFILRRATAAVLASTALATAVGWSQPAPALLAPAVATPPSAATQPLKFAVTFPASARATPVSGRVLLFLSRDPVEPRLAGGFYHLDPVYAIDVKNLAPGTAVTFAPDVFDAPDALASPGPLRRLASGAWRAQAVIDLDQTARDLNQGPGNLYSRPLVCELHGDLGGTFTLTADQVVAPRGPADTDWVKLVEIRSRLLSDFHHRDVMLRAAVVLPSTYVTQPEAKFPVYYSVPGFGGTHTTAWNWIRSARGQAWQRGAVPLQMLQVFLDADVPLGHSVFANSANNGPAGDALVRELIPEIERRFRAIAEPGARFVGGHSSGGWASLWLQVAYPDDFGGCWSTSPDPVDFRAFQTSDLYTDKNGYFYPDGTPHPLARQRGAVVMTYPEMGRWERVLGHGQQLGSFDASFSPRGPDGRPLQVMDQLTGAISAKVVEAWKPYDIRLVLQTNWPKLGPKLQGKLHVLMGDTDTFYLTHATELLRSFLVTTDFGGYVEIVPGDHGTAITPSLRDRIDAEMAAKFAEFRRAAFHSAAATAPLRP